MELVAFVLALAAASVLGAAFVVTRNLVALGLLLLAAAWICASVITGGSRVTVH